MILLYFKISRINLGGARMVDTKLDDEERQFYFTAK